MTANQEEYEYNKGKNEEVTGSRQLYERENDDKPQVDLQLNPYDCDMHNDFEFYSVHAKSFQIEKQSILNTKIDYVDYNKKELLSNRVKFSPTEEKCQNGYKQLQSEIKQCQELNFDRMTEEL